MKNDLTRPTKMILVLDDNEDVLAMLKELISGEGFDVAGFNWTENIIGLVRQVKPDLIIVDYLLSGINGGEYCHQIKQCPETAHLPVIMLSAHQRVIDSLGNYGWDAFVSKPFSVEELVETINKLL